MDKGEVLFNGRFYTCYLGPESVTGSISFDTFFGREWVVEIIDAHTQILLPLGSDDAIEIVAALKRQVIREWRSRIVLTPKTERPRYIQTIVGNEMDKFLSKTGHL